MAKPKGSRSYQVVFLSQERHQLVDFCSGYIKSTKFSIWW